MCPASGSVLLTLTAPDGQTTNVAALSDTLTAFVETKDLELGSALREKHLAVLLVELEQEVPGLTVLIGTRDRLKDAITWSAPLTLDEDNPLYPRVPNARYIRLRFYDPRVNTIWKLSAVELLGAYTGART